MIGMKRQEQRKAGQRNVTPAALFPVFPRVLQGSGAHELLTTVAVATAVGVATAIGVSAHP